jgi:diguanylate cyclase (GGDEF)-like protein
MIPRTFRQPAAIAALTVVLALNGAFLISQRAHHDSLAALSLTERQRLLVYRMLLETTGLGGHAGPLLSAASPAAAEQLFEDNLAALQQGGEAHWEGEAIRAGRPNAAQAAQLQRVQAAWDEALGAMRAMREADAGGPDSAGAAEALPQHAAGLLALLEDTADLYRAERRRAATWHNAALWGLRAGLAGLIVVLVWHVEQRLVRPLRQLRQATQRMSQGRYDIPVVPAATPELELLAESLGSLRARLSRSLSEQARLLSFSQALMSASDERAITQRAVALAAELLRADYGALVLPDAGGALQTRAVAGWPQDYVGRVQAAPSDGSQTAHTIARGEPVVVADYRLGTPFAVPAGIIERGVTSGLSVPLLRDGQAVGALLVHSRQPGHFTPEDVQLVSIIANQTAVALANVRLLANERRRADELEALRATAADTLRASEFELTHLLQMLLERAVTLLNATGGELGILNDAGNALNMVGRHNLDEGRPVTHMALGEGVMGRVAATRQPMIVSDYSTWEGRVAQYERAGWHASMAVPLMAGDRLVGVIGVIDRDPQRQFDHANLRLLMLFGQQAALAIESARLFAAERQRVKEAETLRQAGAIVAASLHQRKAIDLILEQLERVVPYDSASVQMLCDGYLEVVGGHGWKDVERIIGMRFTIPGDNPNTIVIQQRRTHILDDAQAIYAAFRESTQQHIRGWLGVPLIVHDRLIGMLAIDSSEPAHFNAEHARVASAFANHVAIAIENTRLYESAVRAAETQAILYRVGREVSASLEPEQVYAAIHSATAKLMPAETFIISLLTESRTEIDAVYLVDRGTRVFPPRQKVNEALSGHVVATGQPLRVNEPRELAGMGLAHAGHAVHVASVLAVPLRVGETVLGMLSAQSYKPHAYTTEHLHLLELLAVNAAIALSNARLFAQVQRLAITDALTGLHNRRHLLVLAEREFERARRYGRPLAVVMLDLDHFKHVNDAYGHSIGDEVLRTVALRCQAALRTADLLGRYGGEELLAILPESDLAGTQLAAERLRLCVADKPIETTRGQVHVTISLGYALDSPLFASVTGVINQADQELYAAKAAGRNCVRPLAPERP